LASEAVCGEESDAGAIGAGREIKALRRFRWKRDSSLRKPTRSQEANAQKRRRLASLGMTVFGWRDWFGRRRVVCWPDIVSHFGVLQPQLFGDECAEIDLSCGWLRGVGCGAMLE
jgi:hypothetical protein